MRNIFLVLFAVFLLFSFSASAAWEVSAPTTATYSATMVPIAPYATPTDLCVLGTNSSTLIKVFHVRVWGTQTTGGVNGFFLVKRRAFDTFAANTAMTVVPHDSYVQPSGADVTFLTAAPTVGTSLGVVRGADVFVAAPAGLGTSLFDFDFGPSTGVQPIILHQNEMLALNFAGVAVPSGMKISCEFNWTEQ